MRFHQTQLQGVYLIEPSPIEDARGTFSRWFCREEFAAHGLAANIAQANLATNPHRGTLRGLHFQQPPFQEAKLIQCIGGAIFDVIVDLRPDSPAFCQWAGFTLSPATRQMVSVPCGCAHGYQTLEDHSEVLYLTSMAYHPEADAGVRWDDPAFGITWPLPVTRISAKDQNHPDFPR